MATCNLSSIGGGFSQLFFDDGSAGDLHAGDLVFSYRAAVPKTATTGFRSLSCVVSDAQGRIATPQIALTVDTAANGAPTVSAGGPYRVDEGSSVTLAAVATDPEDDPLAYAWDLDGDGVFETPGPTATLFADDGPATRQVRARASDGLLDATDSATVTVANVAPTASLRLPGSPVSGSSFTVSLDAPADVSAADALAGFDYSFDCGAGYGAWASSPSASCASGNPGTVAVGARIRDKDGGVSEYRGAVELASSFESLCTMTRTLSRKARVADRLCRQLAKAERARTETKRRKRLRAYRFQVRAQTGAKRHKAFSPADGALLQRLARELEAG
jgi:PKD domain